MGAASAAEGCSEGDGPSNQRLQVCGWGTREGKGDKNSPPGTSSAGWWPLQASCSWRRPLPGAQTPPLAALSLPLLPWSPAVASIIIRGIIRKTALMDQSMSIGKGRKKGGGGEWEGGAGGGAHPRIRTVRSPERLPKAVVSLRFAFLCLPVPLEHNVPGFHELLPMNLHSPSMRSSKQLPL